MSKISPTGLAAEVLSHAAMRLKQPGTAAPQEFGQFLKSAITEVSDLQKTSANIVNAFEAGDEVDVTKVMIAREKSSLAFEATLQVRNKLLSAYKDIISMPV